MNKTFYISTPIYYPSGKPHIGHAYSTILADVLARYKELIGYEIFFVTGTDEHGQKIQEKAMELNKTPQELVDINSSIFIELWKVLGIKYSKFIRTSSTIHKNVVSQVFSELLEKKFIYLGNWEGLYCVSCEENYTKSNSIIKENELHCIHGHKLCLKKEESYFLKIKEFKEWIKDFLKNNDIIFPHNRINELISSFIDNESFDDLSISRTSFDWGIKIKENNKHVIYVWLDALLNYLSSLGYKSEDNSKFIKFWNSKNGEIVHVMSKEITRFHCIYWPIILKMLNLDMPTKFISHGWIVTREGKMSKSLGNVVDPFELIDKYGRDAVRYFFMKEISLKDDSTFSNELLEKTYNADLANNFGNLINRTLGMLKKYCSSIVPKFYKPDENSFTEFFNYLENFDNIMVNQINSLMVNDITKEIVKLMDKCNLLIENIKPWILFKENNIAAINQTLSLLFIAIKKIIFYLQPILIDGTKKALEQLNIVDINFEQVKNNSFMDDKKLNDSKPIYIRIEK